MGASIGIARHLSALRQGLNDKYGCDGGWQVHIEGACGEVAVAKALGVYWDGSVNTFSSRGDVGKFQVRTRSRSDYELIVRDNDDPLSAYILVTGKSPRFTVKGWIVGADCRRDEWRQEYGGRDAAWFVPQSELKNIKDLV